MKSVASFAFCGEIRDEIDWQCEEQEENGEEQEDTIQATKYLTVVTVLERKYLQTGNRLLKNH